MPTTFVQPLSIPNAGTDSPALSSVLSQGQMKIIAGVGTDIVIYAPAALTNAITVQVAPVFGATVSDWRTMQSSAGTDITVAAGKAVPLTLKSFMDLRIHSAGAEAAQRDFVIEIQTAGF